MRPRAGILSRGAAPSTPGHRQRLADRFRKGGAEALPDYELLELVLFRAIPRRDTKDLAKRLHRALRLVRRGGQRAAEAASRRSRARRGGHHRTEAGARRRPAPDEAERISAPAADVLEPGARLSARAARASRQREQFRILFLDKKNRLIADEIQRQGTVDHTPVYVREVVKRALELSVDRDRPRAQSPLGRPHALARRHRHDQSHRRRRAPARGRQSTITSSSDDRPRELQGPEIALVR